jgi:hypothetical protein
MNTVQCQQNLYQSSGVFEPGGFFKKKIGISFIFKGLQAAPDTRGRMDCP